jgi:6-phosphogluconate dehydrogenase
MPGGSAAAWPEVKPILQAISAKVEDDVPCCDWVGEQGAGHFVKMVHNGIEYGDMQLICEAYQLLQTLLDLSNQELHQVFTEWNTGKLDSYLIQITRDIFAKKSDQPGEQNKHVVDLILDTAGQKGTGKWTVQSALDMGVPVTLIAEAVFARTLSALKQERLEASQILKGPTPEYKSDRQELIDAVRDAVFASKLVSYAQGFQLMRAAAKEYGWKLQYGSVALMWRGGCIIRSTFLGRIKQAFDANPDLTNLLLDPWFVKMIQESQAGWRKVAALAVTNGIPVPAITTALAYYDGFRTARLPANLLQAQRDYFGAHTYERVDKPRGEFFHTNWTG